MAQSRRHPRRLVVENTSVPLLTRHERGFALVCSIPPSMNNMYPTSRTGRRFLSKEGKAFKEELGLLLLEAAPHGWFLHPVDEMVDLRIAVFFRDRRRDASNIIKVLEDGLAHHLGFNDNNVGHIEVWRGIDRDRPRCHVRVGVLRRDQTIHMPGYPLIL
jgi:Holliday junction resolvase RusA-like endonuclease